MNEFNSQKQAAQYLLAAYCLFILYVCFIPFHFNFDPNFIRWRWEVFLTESVPGRTRASLPDVIGNIFLFVPFGILCVSGARQRALRPVVLTSIYGLGLGFAIESGQTLSPWRNPSLLDVMCNGTGALIGAVSGRVMFRSFRESHETGYVEALRQQPSLLVLAYLFLGVVVDSFYPFAATLAPSTIWQNVRQSQFIPFVGDLHRYWFDLFIEKGAIFAVIGYLVSINVQHRKGATRVPLTWLLCSALALTIETGKLFFAGRAFYSENVIIGSSGALVGILLSPRLSAPAWAKHRQQAVCFTLIVGFLIYFELSPFDWISLNELTAQFSRIEWLPFKAYYSAEPVAALFDLQRKIYFLIPLGFVVRSLESIQRTATPRRRGLLLCILIAAGLESLQIFVRSRVPSSTDVIIFSASAWVGIALFVAFQRTTMGMSALSPPRQTNVEESPDYSQG